MDAPSIEVEAHSIETARAQIRDQMIAKGVFFASEEILEQKTQTLDVTGTRLYEDLLETAQSRLPPDTTVTRRSRLQDSWSTILWRVAASTPEEAGRKALKKHRPQSQSVVVGGVHLVSAGKRGFLGIGGKPKLYNVTLVRYGCIRVTYTVHVRLRARYSEKPVQINNPEWILDYMPCASEDLVRKYQHEATGPGVLGFFLCKKWELLYMDFLTREKKSDPYEPHPVGKKEGYVIHSSFGYIFGRPTADVTLYMGGENRFYTLLRVDHSTWLVASTGFEFTD
jgi:hypothetical protein